jgi:hypothetical protein
MSSLTISITECRDAHPALDAMAAQDGSLARDDRIAAVGKGAEWARKRCRQTFRKGRRADASMLEVGEKLRGGPSDAGIGGIASGEP